MIGRLPGNSFVFVKFEQGGGIFEVALLAFAALGLDVAEVGESFLELAGEALAVESKNGEGAMSVDDVEVYGSSLGGWVGSAGEEVGLKERDAVEAPGGVRELVDQLGLGGGGGLVFIVKLLDVALVGGEVFGGQDGGAAGEAVAERVE
jgi:hypothetical protein